jgi:hypothetical protein
MSITKRQLGYLWHVDELFDKMKGREEIRNGNTEIASLGIY